MGSTAQAPVHPPRTHPELSDLALFACAVAAIWFVRRRLRGRRRD